MSHRGSSLAFIALSFMPFALSSCVFVAKGAEQGAAEKAGPSGPGGVKPQADAHAGARAAAEGVAPSDVQGDTKAKDAARKAAKRAHELALARIELEIAELEAKVDADEARTKIERAERELEEARLALGHFKSRKLPRELEDGRLDLDRSIQSKTEAEQELKEMEATYAKDQFAKDTKELVLTRHRKRVEFANRAFAIAEAEFVDKQQVELPRTQRELERKLHDAELALEDARAAQRKQELQTKLELARKRWSIEELERPEDPDQGAKERG
ncbi:MAG: hypothetical protein IT454_21410 [Planctomycetes bacterium]|nr:hypothetical protein [Planctomycetota bacterium]